MQFKRTLTHLFFSDRSLRKAFPPEALQRIEASIQAAEQGHSGEIRFVAEAALEWPALRRGQSARERAIELFSAMHVWDTEHNNGVLIYLLLADHDVEIVADRAIHRHVGTAAWEAICHQMEARFQRNEFETGISEGIAAIATHLRAHYPITGAGEDEIPNRPVLL